MRGPCDAVHRAGALRPDSAGGSSSPTVLACSPRAPAVIARCELERVLEIGRLRSGSPLYAREVEALERELRGHLGVIRDQRRVVVGDPQLVLEALEVGEA